ncbi:hypothetical protein P23_1127 [Acinetobacter calcoaceticus]|nr:hypothetical protein [Acinetobacter calcoaceticus]GAM30624.1 hypothetical protein P23_1127 [Acinetobacter calcoaceticus]
MLSKLEQVVNQWIDLTEDLQNQVLNNLDEVGAAAVDYLYFSGYSVFAYL